MSEKYDVAIIGGGVVGSAIARELSKYDLKITVLERAADVARGTSGKNSGVVHTGINVPFGSVKAKFNVAGAKMFEQYCADLDVPFKRVGKVIVALGEAEVLDLEGLKAKGEANGVPDLEIIDRATLKKLEPNIEGAGALNVPTAAIACPYSLTIALAESATASGVEIKLNSPVTGIKGTEGAFEIETPNETISAGLIVNSAGLNSDKIARMVGVHRWRVWPCRGEYVILDKRVGGLINSMVIRFHLSVALVSVFTSHQRQMATSSSVHLPTTPTMVTMSGPQRRFVGNSSRKLVSSCRDSHRET
jgi:glycerol-3-phosphate dehydrogenase